MGLSPTPPVTAVHTTQLPLQWSTLSGGLGGCVSWCVCPAKSPAKRTCDGTSITGAVAHGLLMDWVGGRSVWPTLAVGRSSSSLVKQTQLSSRGDILPRWPGVSNMKVHVPPSFADSDRQVSCIEGSSPSVGPPETEKLFLSCLRRISLGKALLSG